MSIENFTHWKQTGITGEAGNGSTNCFVAAADCVSPLHDATPDSYRQYDREEPETTKGLRKLFRSVLPNFGVTSVKDFRKKRAKNEKEAVHILENAKIGGWRVIILTSPEHVIGLYPRDGGWSVGGTYLPVDTDIILTSKEVFPYLDQSGRRLNGKPEPNIYLLAPEKKAR